MTPLTTVMPGPDERSQPAAGKSRNRSKLRTGPDEKPQKNGPRKRRRPSFSGKSTGGYLAR